MEIYAYGRVSSRDQNLDRQIAAFLEFGVKKTHIFCDKQSGKDFNRKYYLSLVGTKDVAPRLREGDLLVIYSIDRLGRNYNEIQEQWSYITNDLKADIKVLDMPLLDTRGNDESNLDHKFISDLVLQILSYVAQKEREANRTRQKAGYDCMKIINGKRTSSRTGNPIGRPEIKYPANWVNIYTLWKNKEITAVKAMKKMNLKKNTFYKMVKKYESNIDKSCKK